VKNLMAYYLPLTMRSLSLEGLPTGRDSYDPIPQNLTRLDVYSLPVVRQSSHFSKKDHDSIDDHIYPSVNLDRTNQSIVRGLNVRLSFRGVYMYIVTVTGLRVTIDIFSSLRSDSNQGCRLPPGRP